MKNIFLLIFVCAIGLIPAIAYAIVWPISNQIYTPDIVTSCFGPRYMGPSEPFDFHNGIDVQASFVPFYATSAGYIDDIDLEDYPGGRGLYLVMDHISEYTWFFHLNSIDINIDEGDWVYEGTLLGETGESGYVPPHLHFGYSYTGSLPAYGINPLHWLSYNDYTNPYLDNFDIQPPGGPIDYIDYDVVTTYSQQDVDQDFNSLVFHVYDAATGFWNRDEINFDEKLNCLQSHQAFSWGTVDIDPQNYSPGYDRVINFVWNPSDNQNLLNENYMGLEVRDFVPCFGEEYGCQWGNIWESSPVLAVSDFAGQEGDNAVYLTWSSLLPNVIGFNVYRKEDGGIFTQINREPITCLSCGSIPDRYEYRDTTLKNGGTYYYLLECIAESGESFWASKVLKLEVSLPAIFGISKIYPNPFNSSTMVEVNLDGAKPDRFEVWLFDLGGRRVRSLVAEIAQPGSYRIPVNDRNDSGSELASGVYLIRISWGSKTVVRLITLLK
jgi:hypothetical protein